VVSVSSVFSVTSLISETSMVNSVKPTRDRIIDAAYSQFERTGDVSMRKVGDSVGVTATALYHHFKDKKELLDAIAERGFSRFDSRLRSVRSAEPAGIVREILEGYRQFAADHPSLFGLMFVEPRPVARKFPYDFARHRLALFNLLWKAVADCMEDGADAEESLYLAHDVWAMTHGHILLWRAGRFSDETSFRDVLGQSIDRFIDTL
jgi:AcrR family transcriptional regulator